MNPLSHLKLRTKLILLLGLSVLAVVVSVGLAASQLKERLFSDRIEKLRAATQMTIGIAKSLEQQVAAGQMTRQSAIAQLATNLHAMHFDEGDGYVVFLSTAGLVLAHGGKSELEGKAPTGRDANGKTTTELALSALGNADEGSFFVVATMPGQSSLVAKVAYVARFAPWQAMAFTTAPTNDLELAFRNSLVWLCGSGGMVLLVTLLAAWFINRDIVGSLGGLKTTMDGLAKGDLAIVIPGTERRDEVGGMARTVEVFKRNAMEVGRLNTEQEAMAVRVEHERAELLDQMASQFEATVSAVLASVTAACRRMGSRAEGMVGKMGEAEHSTRTVMQATKVTSQNVQTVAAATEELSASITEIASRINDSATIASDTSSAAEKTSGTIAELSEQAQKIGNILSLISDIATQTNLLALNATIEAARAGDAGKGFSVVASEVKSLATQTARATEEISENIQAVQAATTRAVDEIRQISEVAHRSRAIATSIASAVEQQSAATREISSSVSRAASGTQIVSDNTATVDRSIIEASGAARELLSASNELSGEFDVLDKQVQVFVKTVRSGR
jgi:methyl-accepting chemotaxis protein